MRERRKKEREALDDFQRLQQRVLWRYNRRPGALLPFLLRRLIRRRWNDVYGPLVAAESRKKRVGDAHHSGAEPERAHPLPYAVPWQDGPACGETWAFGAARARRRDPSLFTVQVGTAKPKKGDMVLRLDGDSNRGGDPRLTARVGPLEDVCVGVSSVVTLSHVPPTRTALTLASIYPCLGWPARPN